MDRTGRPISDIFIESVCDGEADIEYPAFVDGERRSPPEDVGGITGFMEFLEAVLDPLHEEHEQMVTWYGKPFEPADIGEWNGEPRGRWDGNTLVVESRYFPDRSQDRFRHVWRAPSASLRVVERFTRVDAGTITTKRRSPTRSASPGRGPSASRCRRTRRGGGGSSALVRVRLPRGELRDRERAARCSRAGCACGWPLIAHRSRLRGCASAETGGSPGDIRV